MKQRLHQLILCSEAEGRAFLRHIIITPVMGRIVMNEVLPLAYENVIERLRNAGELIVTLPKGFNIEGDDACPFCHNTGEFYCRCGSISCLKPNEKVHVCPNCHHIFNNIKPCEAKASQSGFVHGGQSIEDLFGQSGRPRPAPLIEDDEYKAGETFKKVYGFLEKLLPDEKPKNKALPAPKTKKLPWQKD